MKLKMFDASRPDRKDLSHFKFECADPAELHANADDCSTVEDFSFKAFSEYNPHVLDAFAASPDQAEFTRLFKAQVKDGLEQIILANQAKPGSGFVIIARDTAAAHQPIVGFTMGVRNGIEMPSKEYNEQVFSSTCGLSNSMMSAFGPVMSTFDLEKLSKHDNLFMVCMTAVHPDYQRHGIATGIINCLNATLSQFGYDGAFTITTSPAANFLVKKVKSPYHKIFLKTDSICFLGFTTDRTQNAMTVGIKVLDDIDVNCRIKTAVAIELSTLHTREIGDEMRVKLADYVTTHYLAHHRRAAEVLQGLPADKQVQLRSIFKEAMLDSFVVSSARNGVIHFVTDKAKGDVVGFSMGMRFSPSVPPLSPEFFGKAQRECPEFFNIFSETMPLTKPYATVTDEQLSARLGGNVLYYMGMTAYRGEDESVAKMLVQAIENFVFANDAFVGIYGFFSDKFESALFHNSDLQESRIETHQDNPVLGIALLHKNHALIADVLELYSEHKAEWLAQEQSALPGLHNN